MKQVYFNLVPFDSGNTLPIKIAGNIFRTNNQLNIKYILSGNLSTIVVPPVNNNSRRKYDLWEHTCFEFFLKPKNTNKYWEFNLSPTRNWNVFRFSNYRENIAEEMAFDSLPFTILQREDIFTIELNIDLDKIVLHSDAVELAPQKDLDIAITAVVEDKDNQLIYWALAHPVTEADFHHPDGFIVSL